MIDALNISRYTQVMLNSFTFQTTVQLAGLLLAGCALLRADIALHSAKLLRSSAH
jgi:hypothetical protein